MSLQKTPVQLFWLGFKTHFNLRGGDFMDVKLSAATRKPHLDLFKFDDWLHKKFGDYEGRGFSMEKIIATEFSKEASVFIKSIL